MSVALVGVLMPRVGELIKDTFIILLSQFIGAKNFISSIDFAKGSVSVLTTIKIYI